MGFKLKVEGPSTIELGTTIITGVKFRTDIPHDSNARSTDMGSTVTITITLSKPDSLFPAVQPSALQHDAEGAYVWVVNAPQDGAPKTQKRRVEVGRAVNGLQLITAGLQKDDVVVVEGMQKAGEGKTVKVLQAAAQSAGNTSEQPSN